MVTTVAPARHGGTAVTTRLSVRPGRSAMRHPARPAPAPSPGSPRVPRECRPCPDTQENDTRD